MILIYFDMIDIFEEKPQPKIYCVDVTVKAKIPQRGKNKGYDIRLIKLYNQPLLMNDNKIASDRQSTKLFTKIFDEHIHRGDYDNVVFEITSYDNVKFLSNICYHFNYDVD